MRWNWIKVLIALFLTLCFTQSSVIIDYIEVWPYEIKFNYELGNSDDALNIRKDVDDDITIPEWKKDVRNEKFAYIKGQSNRKETLAAYSRIRV